MSSLFSFLFLSYACCLHRDLHFSLHDALPISSVMVRGGGFLIGIGIAWRRGLIRLDAPDWRALPTVFRVGAPLSRSEEHTSELQSRRDLVCHLLLEKKKKSNHTCRL